MVLGYNFFQKFKIFKNIFSKFSKNIFKIFKKINIKNAEWNQIKQILFSFNLMTITILVIFLQPILYFLVNLFLSLWIFVASEARDLLSDAIHFQCLGTHTQWPSFHMYTIPEKGGSARAGPEQVFCHLSPPKWLRISKN